jgi:hypothetical protein
MRFIVVTKLKITTLQEPINYAKIRALILVASFLNSINTTIPQIIPLTIYFIISANPII